MQDKPKLSRRDGMKMFAGLLGGLAVPAVPAVAGEKSPAFPKIERILLDVENREEGIFGKYLHANGTIAEELIIGWTRCDVISDVRQDDGVLVQTASEVTVVCAGEELDEVFCKCR